MPQGVADGLGQIRGGGDAALMGQQPGMQGLDDRSTSFLPRLSPVFGGMAADLALDRVERLDLRQHLGRERRLGGDVELVKVPPHVGPAEREADRAVGAVARQPLEPGIAIDLQHAAECRQMPGGTHALAILGVDVGRHRGRRAAPWPVIDRVAPEPPGLGPAATGVEHRQRRVVGEQLGRGQPMPTSRSYSGVSHQQARPTQLLKVERSSVTPCRASICAWRYSGRLSQNLLTTTCAISASVAMPPSIGRSGAGATTTAPSQARQA